MRGRVSAPLMDLVPVGGDALGRLRKRLQKIEKFYAL